MEAKCEEIEKFVVKFLSLAREHGETVTGPMLRQMAQEEARMLGIEDFKASQGWLSHLKDRHEILSKAVHGEAKSVNVPLWRTGRRSLR